ncbi:MAG: hypothetical protein ACI83O_000579 [Patescibacteria group bacterium]|jgi:hypothetical protein
MVEKKEFVKKDPADLRPVQRLAGMYYSRKDISAALFDFCKNRETVPRYLEGFGKRPDCFDYPTDISIAANKGATSFHCSEEIWSDPLKINTDFTPEQYNEIKIGWDFLIDIDSKYLDYSKIAAKLLLKALREHGVKNVGIKFSGSKGFHIIVPFAAFPYEVHGELTKDKFPEWPRYIADYLGRLIKKDLDDEIFKITTPEDLEKKGLEVRERLCPLCNKPTVKKQIGRYVCPNFRCRSEVKSMKSNRKKMMCPSCNDSMPRVEEEEVYFCKGCKINSAQMKSMVSDTGGSSYSMIKRQREMEFTETFSAEKAIDSVDIVLVASRHLFRAPYSLHEKTALASIVISEEDLDTFEPTDADPLKITEVKDFMPVVEFEEGKDLLLEALKERRVEKAPELTAATGEKREYSGEGLDYSTLTITPDMYPAGFKKLLKGIQGDGRKRCLYLLLSFFNALQMDQESILEQIVAWNKKNKVPLKEGYMRGQLDWFSKRKILPPNYDKPVYKEFGITGEDGIKNPITYTIRKALKGRGRK